MNVDTFLEQFGHLVDAPEGIKKLRELILNLAIRGKLVEQDPNDEPAKKLVERIKSEKRALIEQKVIKVSQSHTLRNTGIETHSIPEGWVWETLDEITSIGTGSTPSTGELKYYKNGKIPWQTSSATGEDFITKSDKFITDIALQECRLKIYPKGSLIVALYGQGKTRGQVGQLMFDSTINQACAGIAFFLASEPIRDFIRLVFKKKYAELRELAAGGAQPNLNGGLIRKTKVPIPPLNEQKRIVAKVDELMALCDALETQQQQRQTVHGQLTTASLHQLTTAETPRQLTKAWQRIDTQFNQLFTTKESIKQLRQTILQLAVQGKLVPQDPEDEPAENLLERIKSEKQDLIKRKVIKVSKSHTLRDSGIETHSIPKGWEWEILDEITNIGTGSTPSTGEPKYYKNGNIPWQTSSSTGEDFITKSEKFITDIALKECRLKVYPKGSLIVALYGQGKTRGQVAQLMFDSTINQACAGIAFFPASEPIRDFIRLVFKKKYDELRELAAGGAQPNLNGGIIRQTKIPIPPLNEQKRIVVKVAQLMALCDELELNLEMQKNNATNLSTAMTASLLNVE
ncbi:MAG: hypothetical protein CME33_02945 [Gimesia sp.]|uniref:restriction endonuclease subunit S n=1 Tax=Gimesia sp. TaxID=2024833 RepID=UPI000C48A0E3|nr:restriction endonuclease subunit S [Gimesia sp.]MAX35508.1 hypothetical protein [Gimesia sp.]